MARWPGLDERLVPGAIVWFGETHGTEQSPRFVGDVVEYTARRGPVQLALELPHDLQPQLLRYLASDGGAAARAALLEGEFWGWRDGRGSEAMVALVERVRVRQADGVAIELVAFDVDTHDGIDARGRDRVMAERLVACRDPAAVMVVLSGGIHARRVAGASWDEAFVPAAAHLIARGLAIATFAEAADGGTFWGIVGALPCPRCGVHENSRDDPGEPWTIGLVRDDAYDGTYRVGPTVASPPATG